jgi:hypothetical protein
VLGKNGKDGYVRTSDLMGSDAQTPEEALAWQEEHRGETRTIPVYDVDGKTIIDEFVLTRYDPESMKAFDE